MRIEKITDNLYSGGCILSYGSFDKVKSMGITHIIDLDARCDLQWQDVDNSGYVNDFEVEVLHYYLADDGGEKPTRFWRSTIDFGKGAIEQGGTVYSHCSAGRCRGPSVAYGILRATGKSVEESTRLIEKYFERLNSKDVNYNKPENIRYKEQIESKYFK